MLGGDKEAYKFVAKDLENVSAKRVEESLAALI